MKPYPRHACNSRGQRDEKGDHDAGKNAEDESGKDNGRLRTQQWICRRQRGVDDVDFQLL